MRKPPIFSAVLTLFLLVPASITWAQITKTINGTVSYESGMSKTTLSTPNGNVVVNLPQSLTGSVITGTVSTQPAGKTEKEKNRNLKELLKSVLNLGGQKIPLSASTANFNWTTTSAGPGRTPLELLNISGSKIAEVSLPPVLSESGWQSASVPVLNGRYIVVQGDALNIYTNQQFTPGKNFVITDGKGQNFIVKPICQSANEAVLTIPDGAALGHCKVRMEEDEAPYDVVKTAATNVAEFNLIDINLTSPNTNLKPGQESFVLCEIKDFSFDPLGEIFHPSLYAIDLRNLNPNTVTMEGGNLQRVNLPGYSKVVGNVGAELFENGNWVIKRNITGNTVGTFSISATLHEDYNTCNDPFKPQLNALSTPQDFNNWANALKKDLGYYAEVKNTSSDEMTPRSNLGSVPYTNIQRAINNMPVCNSPEQLDEVKAVAYSLVKPLNIPKGVAVNSLSSYEAGKAALKAIDNTLAGKAELVDYDVINAGMESIKKGMGIDVYPVQQLIDVIKNTTETREMLQDLKKKAGAVIDKMNTGNLTASYKYFDPPKYLNKPFRFNDAFITELTFPVLDVSDKRNSGLITLKLIPEGVSFGTDKKKNEPPIQQKQKTWMAANFQFQLGDMPCNNVNKLDLPKITMKVAGEHTGAMRQTGKEKFILPDLPDFKFLIPEADIKPWQDWYNNYEKQLAVSLKNGSAQVFDQLENPIFSVSFDKVKPVNIHPTAAGNFIVTLHSGETSVQYNPLPGIQFNNIGATYVANEIAGDPCNPEGATTFTWLYIEKPCRVEMATTRASNIDPEAEDILNDIQDLLGEVSEDGAELGGKLAKTFSIGQSFAVWIRVVRDWESYKAEYVCRNGVWQHGEMKLVNSGVKEITPWQLFRGESGNDTWTKGDDMKWIMKKAEELKAGACNQTTQ